MDNSIQQAVRELDKTIQTAAQCSGTDNSPIFRMAVNLSSFLHKREEQNSIFTLTCLLNAELQRITAERKLDAIKQLDKRYPAANKRVLQPQSFLDELQPEFTSRNSLHFYYYEDLHARMPAFFLEAVNFTKNDFKISLKQKLKVLDAQVELFLVQDQAVSKLNRPHKRRALRIVFED